MSLDPATFCWDSVLRLKVLDSEIVTELFLGRPRPTLTFLTTPDSSRAAPNDFLLTGSDFFRFDGVTESRAFFVNFFGIVMIVRFLGVFRTPAFFRPMVRIGSADTLGLLMLS
jgi:hypothetical protein